MRKHAFNVLARSEIRTMPKQSDKPVLVTGANSGLGRAICEFLSSKKRYVYAGVRKQKDFAELAKLPRVTPLLLDVTNSGEVERAVRLVHESGGGLYGLVNCAGVAGLGPLIDTSVEELNRVLGVNLVGTHRVINACGPMLVESKGRIVNISSIGAFMTDVWLGPYGTSKHALEGYTEILREELAMHGLSVSIIEPMAYRSNLATNAWELLKDEADTKWERSIFREQIRQVLNWYVKTPGVLDRSKYPDPTPVAEAVYDALFSHNPKPRYLVADRETARQVIDSMLARVIQVNDGQSDPVAGSELTSRLQKALREKAVKRN
jgi:NAD(P)-dependent dehydrogenase (short-subunit alcohol dehydrogenase family)